MESLLSARIKPLPTHCRQIHSSIRPTLALQFARRLEKGQMEMGCRMSFNPIAASVQPIEGPTLSQFNNTSPSKGHHKLLEYTVLSQCLNYILFFERQFLYYILCYYVGMESDQSDNIFLVAALYCTGRWLENCILALFYLYMNYEGRDMVTLATSKITMPELLWEFSKELMVPAAELFTYSTRLSKFVVIKLLKSILVDFNSCLLVGNWS